MAMLRENLLQAVVAVLIYHNNFKICVGLRLKADQ
jgi:hypothetical protein